MPLPLQTSFFKKTPNISLLCECFEQLPNVYFILKDYEGSFIYLNSALVNRLKLGDQETLLGLTDYDLYPENLAKLYRQEDIHVLHSTKQVAGEIHQVVDGEGQTSWFHTVKKTVLDTNSRVIGLIGIMRDCHAHGTSLSKYKRMEQVLEHIKAHYDQQLTVESLANLLQMSPSHFQRVFREVFQLSPMKMVMQTRIRAARELILNSDHTITEVAYLTGFYDHSHLTKQFKKDHRMSPKTYREKYAL